MSARRAVVRTAGSASRAAAIDVASAASSIRFFAMLDRDAVR